MGREISSAECGENRISRYPCPGTCPFNPFIASNYGALLEAEGALDRLTLERLKQDPVSGPAYQATVRDAVRQSPLHGMHAAASWHLFFERDAAGRTFAGRWERDGFREFRNDERVLFRAKTRVRVALIEVRHVIDDQQFTAVDLLDPGAGELRFIDRSLVRTVGRFTTLLTWVFPLPHFWRVSGNAITVDDLGPFTALEAIDACVAHLGGPAEAGAKRTWLAKHFTEIDRALFATGHERRRQMLAAIDARFGAATYDLQVPDRECIRRLANMPDLAEDDVSPQEKKEGFKEAFVWFDAAPAAASATAPGGRPVLGRVLVAKKVARVEAIGGQRLTRLRTAFESGVGDGIRFNRERIDDLGGRMAAKEPQGDLRLIPPKLLESPTEFLMTSSRLPELPPGEEEPTMAVLQRRYRQAWLDEALPALDGRSPRQAAKEFALRPRLLELVKTQIRQLDRQNLATGGSEDINGLVRELGLSELDVPPPPRRAVPPADDDFDDDLDDDDDVDPDDAAALTSYRPVGAATKFRPAPPRLPRKALSVAQASDRLNQAIAPFATAAAAMEEIEASGSTVLDEIESTTEGLLTEIESALLTNHVIRLWFALVPPGSCAPEISYEKMDEALDRFEAGLDPADKVSGPMASLLDDCRQPTLLKIVYGELLEMADSLPKKQRFTPEASVTCAIVLRFLIDAMDEAIGRG